MISPWHNPLPWSEYTTSRVVVYFYDGRWVPIIFCQLKEAIELYRQGWLSGVDIVVFPPDLNPCEFEKVKKSSKVTPLRTTHQQVPGEIYPASRVG